MQATVGSVVLDAGRGLSLGPDHGIQYRLDHFQNQLRYRGISPSFTFIERPLTNGVAWRFIKALKKQVIHGRVFQHLQEVRVAVRRLVDHDNRKWLVERMVSKALARPSRHGSPRPHSPGQLHKNLCAENLMRYTRPIAAVFLDGLWRIDYNSV